MNRNFPDLPPGFAYWRPLVTNSYKRTFWWCHEIERGVFSKPVRSIPEFTVNGQAVDVWVAEPTTAVKVVTYTSLILTFAIVIIGLLFAALLAFHAAASTISRFLQ